MALLDGLILDSLLNPPVVIQEIWLANRTDAKGSGTQADPYQAGGGLTDADPIFDQVMRAIAAAMSTGVIVRLQPGTYFTRGANLDYNSTTGWRAKSGLRLVGAGVGVTTLKLTNSITASTHQTSAIGIGTSSPADGLDISDLTIDANLSGSTGNQIHGGIAVNGQNILIRRIEVKNFGSGGTASDLCAAISLANASSSYQPFNCIIDSCVARLPGGSTSAGTVAFYLQASQLHAAAKHLLCVIRNCYADFAATGGSVSLSTNYMGISAGGGTGTIVENNQIRNCRFGISWGCVGSTADLVIRANNFTNVPKVFCDGLRSDPSTSPGIERIILLNNTTDWPNTTDFSAPIGVEFTAYSSSSTTIFKNVIARGNIFRRPYGYSANGNEIGLSFRNCTNVIAENTVVDIGSSPNNALRYEVCASVKAFNTKKPDGTFVPGYYITAQTHIPEITTDVEDALLAI